MSVGIYGPYKHMVESQNDGDRYRFLVDHPDVARRLFGTLSARDLLTANGLIDRYLDCCGENGLPKPREYPNAKDKPADTAR